MRETLPADQWQEVFERSWPAYRSWFRKEGADARPSLATCRERLRHHMPELIPVWEHLTGLAGDDEEVARMLSLHRPTPYLSGCSQGVWTRGDPLLVRNYDYHPAACEGVFLLSNWRGTRVIASSDCLWGALDGMNEHGLVVALSFGGSREVGDGFGIPLILRYVLELARSVADAMDVLRRLPSFMAYNVSLLDASGDYAVAALRPDREPEFDRRPVATNHQRKSDWSEYVTGTRSREREARLRSLLADPELDRAGFIDAFLEPPLHAREYTRGIGTLYTAVYDPRALTVECVWPRGRYRQSFDDFTEQQIVVPTG